MYVPFAWYLLDVCYIGRIRLVQAGGRETQSGGLTSISAMLGPLQNDNQTNP